MSLIEIFLLAVGLAMDASAVSLAAAASGYAKDSAAAFRLSFHFGLFQFLMPVIGWFLGKSLVEHIASVDHWIAFALLGIIGVRMIRSGIAPDASEIQSDPSRGLTLITLSIATSIDALAVGLSIAILDVSILLPSVMIGLITACLCLIAIRLGNRLSLRFGQRMEVVGGTILIVIGLRMLVSHLFF